MNRYLHSIRVDPERCTGLMKCLHRCPTQAIRVRDKKALILDEKCVDCGECINACSNGAIVPLTNPISADMAVMRTSLLPGLVSAVLRNTNRQQPRVRMFETGLRFLPGEDCLKQVPTLAMVLTPAWKDAGTSPKPPIPAVFRRRAVAQTPISTRA